MGFGFIYNTLTICGIYSIIVLYIINMAYSSYKKQFVMFIVMVIIGMMFNPMTILAYRFTDLYISLTLFYGGLLMASNMIWTHEIVHYLTMGHFNIFVFSIGIILSIGVSVLLLRKQFLVDDTQWLKRMISHHSTALTTSHNIYNRTNNNELKTLAKTIIDTQEKEIQLMKSML
jgi:glucan phosphoethanolaminetransferase (alkaline phosphatase superfamily)